MRIIKQDTQKIGKRIRKIRKEQNLTLEEFGKLFSPFASRGTVSNWENGKFIPNKERIEDIAKIGKVNELYLLYGIEIEDYGLNKFRKFNSEELQITLNALEMAYNQLEKEDKYKSELFHRMLDKEIYIARLLTENNKKEELVDEVNETIEYLKALLKNDN